jgi:hypothetical protein
MGHRLSGTKSHTLVHSQRNGLILSSKQEFSLIGDVDSLNYTNVPHIFPYIADYVDLIFQLSII